MNFHSTGLKYLSILGILFLSLTLFTSTAFSASLAEEEQEIVLSEAELAQTLAPIALYPDTLLTHILIASTYPIEVIEAERWLNKHAKLTASQVEKKAEKKDWDASIKALLAFPRVMEKLSEDLTWMQKLGDAFLQDEERVLASIQALRQQADEAGSLANIDNVKVIKEQRIIIIEPAQPEIIYVPYYDTRLVYGRWYWAHYPPVYWHSPPYYAAHHSPFYWGHGVHISSRFYFSTFNWHNRHVVVNHYNRSNHQGNYAGYHPRKKIVTSHQAKRWSHQPKHRRGVAYSHGRVKQKYYGNSVQNNKNVRRNNKIVSGSSYKVKPYKSTQQVNRHKDFNKKLKVKSHQQSKPYSKQAGHKVSKTNSKKYADNRSFKKDKSYSSVSKNSNNTGKSVYKAQKPSSRSVDSTAKRTKVHQPSKHKVSSQRQSVKKTSVHSRPQHKSKERVK
ncbi:DUF3300 domain-containing protein [Colwellia sp. 75C3]|uniref:DUF3300 domain-containing protein n=1 Tax=Colwellia sp. 75C3 TaxID=888425 RepID=UPI000C349520|nr:DUF3300 domain-containing protein [Colwellia sp. 75C3]PKG81042.1 DUF3300 domain-containing protein [Colwellia sp. 75C3]